MPLPQREDQHSGIVEVSDAPGILVADSRWTQWDKEGLIAWDAAAATTAVDINDPDETDELVGLMNSSSSQIVSGPQLACALHSMSRPTSLEEPRWPVDLDADLDE